MRTILLLLATSISFTATAQNEKKDAPNPLDELITEGRRHLGAGQPGKAEAIFRKATERFPDSAVAHNELGVALFQQGANEAAIKPFQQAVRLDKKLAHAWANLAESQRLSKRFKKAALSYHRFLTIQKGDRYGVYGMGLCFEGYEKFDKALKTLRIAERRSQSDPALLARVNRAILRVREKMAEAKLSLLARGDARLMAGRWKEALTLYEKGLAKKKGDAVLTGRRGISLAILGDLPGARTALEAALLKDPSVEVNRAAYGLVLDAQGVAPAGGDAGDGDALLKADRAAAARLAFARRLLTISNPAGLFAKRGEASLRMGDLKSASGDFLMDSADPMGRSGTAEIHLLRGNAKAAQETVPDAPVAVGDIPLWRRSLLEKD